MMILTSLLLIPASASLPGQVRQGVQSEPLLPVEEVVEVRGSAAASDPLAVKELRVYDIGPLVGRKALDDLVQGVLRSAGRVAGPVDVERLRDTREQLERVRGTAQSVSLVIKKLLEPAYDEGLNSMTILGAGRLAVIANDAQHLWLAAFIENAAAFDGLIDIQVRICKFAADVPPGILPFPHINEGAALSSVLSKDSTEELLSKLPALDAELVHAPRVLTHPFGRAELSVLTEIPYVADYEVKSLPGRPETFLDPVLATAEDGTRTRLRCAPLTNGKIWIDAGVEVCNTPTPIPTKHLSLGTPPVEVTVQVPDGSSVSLAGFVELAPGESLAMTVVDPSVNRTVLVLISANRAETDRD